MIGKTISHYRILEKLGEGGMGVVYKAEDTKLKRQVALKFLPSELTRDPDAKSRFIQEAQAASALNHPNICVIHEIDEADDQSFIAMECVEGKTLGALLEERGLSPSEALDVAIQVTEGLTAAHKMGIVHRDIKPDNIMVTHEGRVKIMDFGLAKLKGLSTLTKEQSTLGTLSYMSPEQVQGLEADQRSDIFSLGVVLYEMLTGRRPFRGEHEAAVMYSLLNETPEPLARYKSGVPEDVQRIVDNALVKDRDKRYQRAEELLADLRREKERMERATSAEVGFAPTGPASAEQSRPPKASKWALKKTLPPVLGGLVIAVLVVGYFALFGRGKPEPGRKMLAVLPFENLGGPDQEYFAAGITDEITTHLVKVSGLGVISRTSVLQYKGTKKTIQQIGKELGVQYVLEGTVLWDKSGPDSRVRINPQLIRVKDGTHVWAETYDRVLDQVFALQSDVAEKVTSALDVTLLETERGAIESPPTKNLEAYDYYLRGEDYSFRAQTEKEARLGIEMYERAVELDPGFALAYARLSFAHSWIYWFCERTDENLNGAKQAVDRALELNPSLPEAHLALGIYYYWGRLDYGRALEQLEIARKGQPNNGLVAQTIGVVLRRQGKFEEALVSLKKAAELDPRNNERAGEVAVTYGTMRKYAEAVPYFDRAISLRPDEAFGYYSKAWLYVSWRGDRQEARKALEEATRKADPELLTVHLVELDVLDGDYQEALDRLPSSASFVNELGFNDVATYFLAKARICGLLNQQPLRQAYSDSARVILERTVRSRPEDAMIRSQLGIAYAGLGRSEDAVREGRRAVELLPVSKDALEGPERALDLARIYAMVGDYDAAMDQLTYLLSIPAAPGAQISVPILRLDPTWAALRNNPRFQKLLAGGKKART
jgi:TolB-like protein/Flp pilus assembly protein TadD/predicted Ser/Thr protein kinase